MHECKNSEIALTSQHLHNKKCEVDLLQLELNSVKLLRTYIIYSAQLSEANLLIHFKSVFELQALWQKLPICGIL